MKTHEKYEQQLFDREIYYQPIEPYKGSKHAILHECIKGHQWKAQPSNILAGRGCPRCSNRHMRNEEEYISDLKTLGITYSIEEPYIDTNTNIKHRCPDCTNIWSVKPRHILRGHGCPVCMSTGFDITKPGTLYYIRIIYEGTKYYKLGITNTSISKRFAKDKDKEIKILYKKLYENGLEAKEKEAYLLRQFSGQRVKNIKILKSHGNSELFLEDILNFDIDY